MIIPYPPGGAGDIVGRLLGAKLEADPRPADRDRQSRRRRAGDRDRSDGACAAGRLHGLSREHDALDQSRRCEKLPYDTIKDFTPITLVASSPLVFVAHPSLGVVEHPGTRGEGEGSPGTINYGVVRSGDRRSPVGRALEVDGGHRHDARAVQRRRARAHRSARRAGADRVHEPAARDAAREVRAPARARADERRSARRCGPICRRLRNRAIRGTSRRCGTRCSRRPHVPRADRRDAARRRGRKRCAAPDVTRSNCACRARNAIGNTPQELDAFLRDGDRALEKRHQERAHHVHRMRWSDMNANRQAVRPDRRAAAGAAAAERRRHSPRSPARWSASSTTRSPISTISSTISRELLTTRYGVARCSGIASAPRRCRRRDDVLDDFARAVRPRDRRLGRLRVLHVVECPRQCGDRAARQGRA